MPPWMIGAGLGALGGLFGSKGNSNPYAAMDSRGSASTSQQQQQNTTPHPYEYPFLGFGSEMGNYLTQNPVPFFPGQTYVGPSAPTQLGIAGLMGVGGLGLGAAQNIYGMAGDSQPYYKAGAEMGMRGLPGFEQAAGTYNQAAGMGQQGLGNYLNAAGTYGQAGSMGQGVANQYGASGALANQAIGTQQGLNAASLGNYGFLSGAADVANNPYVQGQIAANERSVKKGLLEDVLPQIGDSAQAVNALGSSRMGLLEGQAVGDAAEALANTNASTMLNAYGQGLGAQQSALGQTGAMLSNQLAPAQAAGYAANQGMAGMNALGAAAGMQNQAGQQYGQMMDQLGRAAGYQSTGAAQYGLGMQQAGAAGDMTQRGISNYMSNMQGAGGLANNALAGILQAGQGVEGYQGKALQDAMNRWGHQFQEPQQRLALAQQLSNWFGKLGTTNTNSTGYTNTSGYDTQPNPNYQNPFGAAIGGGLWGAGIGKNW